MAVPAWFQAPEYFANKLSTMSYAQAADGEQQLANAFTAAGYNVSGIDGAQLEASAEQLLRHFEDYGNAENISPNNYFNVDFYRAAKLAQVQEIGQPVPGNFPAWSDQALDYAMEQAGLSYWDHYIQYGTAEGINPSAQFDTDRYLQMKADQLNSLANPQIRPDGTYGDWTPEMVAEAFRAANLNAVEHYMLYNAVENIGYEPGPEAPAFTKQLTTGVDTLSDDGVATNFVATNAPGSEQLNPGDKITATSPDSELTLTLDNAGFSGFAGNGGMTGVKTVNVSGSGTFYADGVTGATTYNMDGSANLFNLGKDVSSVNLSNVSSPVMVSLASAAQAGSDTALTLGLNNVATSATNPVTGETTTGPVKILGLGGIEAITVNSTGEGQNQVDLSSAAAMTSLKFAGANDVSVSAVDRGLTGIDASAASGDVTVNASAATGLKTFTGGAGDDTLVYSTSGSRTLNLTTDGLENLQLSNAGSVTVNGANMKGLESIVLDNQDAAVTLNKFTGQTLNIDVIGSEESTGRITAGDVSGLVFDVAAGASYNGQIAAANATRLKVGGDGDFTLAGGNLNNVADLTVAGSGNVDLTGLTSIGSKAQNLFVQAGANEGTFSAEFAGNSTVNGQNLFVYGGDNGVLNVTASGANYDFIQVAGGAGKDSVTIRGTGNTVFNSDNLSVDLGGGNNTLTVFGNSSNCDFSNLQNITTLNVQNPLDSTQMEALAAAGVTVNNMTVSPDGSVQTVAKVVDGTAEITPAAGVKSQTVDMSAANDTVEDIVIAPSSTPVMLENLNPTNESLSITTGADTTLGLNDAGQRLDNITAFNVTVEDGATFQVETNNIRPQAMLKSAENLVFSGDGSVEIGNQIGSTSDIHAVSIDAAGLTGGYDGLSLSPANTVVSNSFVFTGGAGNDRIGVSAFGSATVDLGNGDNTLGYMFGWAQTTQPSGASDAKNTVVTAEVTLGEIGQGTDTIVMRASNQPLSSTGAMTSNQGAGAFMTVRNFDAGTDCFRTATGGDGSGGAGRFANIIAPGATMNGDASTTQPVITVADMVQLVKNFTGSAVSPVSFGTVKQGGTGNADISVISTADGHNYAVFDTTNGSLTNACESIASSVDVRSVALVDLVGVTVTDATAYTPA